MNIVLHHAEYSQYSTVYCHDELWIVQARTVRFVIQVKLSWIKKQNKTKCIYLSAANTCYDAT